MPTVSQCQILNSLGECELVRNDDEFEEGTDKPIDEPRSVPIISDPGSSEQHPKPHDSLPGQDNPRSNSAICEQETASFAKADEDVTRFQLRRIQTAPVTRQILSVQQPKGLYKTIFQNSRSALYLWNVRHNIAERKPEDTTGEHDLDVRFPNVNSQAFSPWRVPLSENHPISPALDNTSRSPASRQGLPETPVPTTGSQEIPVLGKGSHADESNSATGNEQRESKGTQDSDIHAIVVRKKQSIVAKNKLMFDIKYPDKVKDQLYQLGWRRPRKKKKSKKKEEKTFSVIPSLSVRPNMRLNLATDPVLIKISKKSKNMIAQTGPPNKRPRAVCFDIVGAHLTHLNVWKAFQRDVMSVCDDVKLESIQFSPRSIFVPRTEKSDPVENRWVITLTSEWFRNRVTGMKITFGAFTTCLRRYDEVADWEFRHYTRMTNLMKMVKPTPAS